MSILDRLEDVDEEDVHIIAIRMAEFTNSPAYWRAAQSLCEKIKEVDLAIYCYNMSEKLDKFRKMKSNV